MSMLAQAYAGTGDEVYKRKLDYMVAGLGECQDALAAAARKPTPRAEGKFSKALRLTGSPLGHAEHVSLPEGIVSGLNDFTIATWINLGLYDRAALSDPKADPSALNNGVALFDFGSPNAEFAAAPLSRMYLIVRVVERQAGPAIRDHDAAATRASSRSRARRRCRSISGRTSPSRAAGTPARSTSTARPPAPTPR